MRLGVWTCSDRNGPANRAGLFLYATQPPSGGDRREVDHEYQVVGSVLHRLV